MRALIATLAPIVWLAGCGPLSGPAVELAAFPLDGTNGILTQDGVAFDDSVSSDGKGSIRISATAPRTVRLFEVDGADTEGSRLNYRARIRTEDVKGKVYLEMWVVMPGMGEFFSRGLEAPLSGTVDWTTQEIPFFLQEGQSPERIKLNVVVDGTGSVWIDDLVLSKS